MVDVGDHAPDFTAPLAHGDDDVGSFTLSERLDEAPLVLAFFPGAFTSTCSHELTTFQARLSAFADAGGTVYGISVDSPFAQNAFREQLGLTYGLVSDANRELIEAYDVTMAWKKYGLDAVAKRAVFVVDGDGEITYAWVAEDTKTEPDYDEILAAVDASRV
ncbi:redoxin domain-containing protein [Salinirubrum litoreum]|uniref:Redoxin domain-containing protein n=1 Tax=Salinirubrum litoreum TaxID=1126234 RepID=A0ABD5R690_9EURY|nr:redoxin domain-containing protein [Salinirubrum litoreum]